MEDELTLGIYVPSCGRADTTKTYKFLERCTYVVRKSEEEEYRKAGIKDIWAVEDSEIDSFVKVSNYIIDHAPEDIIFTIDDDVTKFLYRQERKEEIKDNGTIMAEIERIAQVLADLDLGMAAEDACSTPWNYTGEFDFKGTTGAIRWFNKKAFKSRFDDRVYHNCDIDVELQELVRNRVILRPLYLIVDAGTDTNKGGNSSKTRQEQKDCVTEMKRKWGKYFDYDFKSNKPKIRVHR